MSRSEALLAGWLLLSLLLLAIALILARRSR